MRIRRLCVDMVEIVPETVLQITSMGCTITQVDMSPNGHIEVEVSGEELNLQAFAAYHYGMHEARGMCPELFKK